MSVNRFPFKTYHAYNDNKNREKIPMHTQIL